MNFKVICSIILACGMHAAFSQVQYAKRIEASFQQYQFGVVEYDDSPGFQGDRLTDNGFDINMVNGFSFNKHLFMGAGLGYGNYGGDNALQAFFHLEATILKSKLSPLINFKLGYNHLFNQYEGGSSGFIVEGGVGLSYQLSGKYIISLQSGGMIVQDAMLWPIRVGFGF